MKKIIFCLLILFFLLPAAFAKDHGLIKYKLLDLKKNSLIQAGENRIQEVTSENMLSDTGDHSFKIYDDFIVGMNRESYPDKQKVCGIGMWLERSGQETFSWEWYSQVDENSFKKLHGDGMLKVEYKHSGENWVISKITFTGEHVFRASKFGNLFNKIASLKKRKGDWQCIIADGSYIEW